MGLGLGLGLGLGSGSGLGSGLGSGSGLGFRVRVRVLRPLDDKPVHRADALELVIAYAIGTDRDEDEADYDRQAHLVGVLGG